MSAQPDKLFGITTVPPAVGAAPVPPEAIRAVLDTFDELRTQPRSGRDTLATGLSNGLRRAIAALVKQPYRPRAHGMSASESAAWAAMAAQQLGAAERGMLLEYVQACRTWAERLAATIATDKADPDWDMTSARNVKASEPEAYLAKTLEDAGISVQAQVGVAKERGGRRRGGWHGSYWLDCAHRDPAYRLRINIELDGKHHYNQERWARDQRRNEILAGRGWYVVRISGKVLGADNHRLALEQLVALTERHRHAIVLARSHWPALKAALGSTGK